MRPLILASTTLATLALAAPGTAQDAGAALAAELGYETTSMLGLTGPAGGQGIALTTTRTLDVGEPVAALDGFLFRSRFIVVGPQGVVAVHSHEERPAISYVVNGSILEMRSANEAPVRRAAGDYTLDTDIAQWWYNDSDEPVLIFVGDLCPEGSEPACELAPMGAATAPVFTAPEEEPTWDDAAGSTTLEGLEGPADPIGLTSETLGTIDLSAALVEVEGLGDLSDRVLRARRVTLDPGGILPLHVQPDRPNYLIVTAGALTYYGEEGTLTLGPTQTFEDFGPQPTWYRNDGDVPMELFAIDVFDTGSESDG